jgi:hypothetical protein
VERWSVTPLFAGLFALGTAEMLLYFQAPKIYGHLARLPLGKTRRLVLHPRAQEALRAPATESAAGYRASALGAIDLGRLALPDRLEIDAVILHFAAGRGFAIARMPYTFSKRAYGLVRVDLMVTDGALELRPRFIMMGWPSMALLAPIGVIAVVLSMDPSKWMEPLVMGALFIALNAVIGWFAGRGRLESGVDAIERQIQHALMATESR